MSRTKREAKLEAMMGPNWAIVTESGGRASNRKYAMDQTEKSIKQALLKKLRDEGSYFASPTRTNAHSDEPSMQRVRKDSYQEGSLGSSPPDTFGTALQEVGAMRGPGAYTADIPMHATNMRNLARGLHPYLGPATGPVLEGAGWVNEAIDAGRGLLRGGSQAGFDPTDLVANRVGIMQGISEAEPSWYDAAVDWLSERMRRDERAGQTQSPSASSSIRG